MGIESLAASTREEIGACDIVYVEHIWSGLFPLIFARIYGKRSVVDNHNVETMLANRSRQEARGFLRRVLAFLWLFYVLLLEKISCSLAGLVIVTSDTDRELLCKNVGVSKKKIEVIPNGLDIVTFRPSCDEGLRARAQLCIDRNAPVIMFVGMLDYRPNLYALRWIVKELAPKIHQRKPDVCIAPMTVGSGTRMKILCYLSCDKPVVSTRLGVEGLDSSVTANVSFGNLNEFPDLIFNLLTSPERRPERQVRKTISRYDWKRLSTRLEDLLIDLTGTTHVR